MSNEMNSIPVKDSKGNITGISSANEEDALINDLLNNILASGKLNILPADNPLIQPGQRDLGTEVTKKTSAELNRWLRENYPTKDPSKPGYKLPPKHPGNVLNRMPDPIHEKAHKQLKKLRKPATPNIKTLSDILTQKTPIGTSGGRKSPLISRGGIPGAGIGSLLLYLLAAKPGIEGALQDALGLNETEVWRNPDRYGTGESYDPSMDPNHPAAALNQPIEELIKKIPY